MITKKPIKDVKNLGYGSLLFRAMTSKYKTYAPSVSQKELGNRNYVTLDIMSIETMRPTDNRTGLLFEGILVDIEGNQLPETSPIRDVSLLFDQSDLRMDLMVWTDNREMAEALVKEMNEKCLDEALLYLEEWNNYVAFLKSEDPI